MELRQLRYAVAVADRGSFRAAAAALYVAQPAVSQQVAGLEREIGIRLFDRDAHHVAVTGPGLAFLDAARHVLAAADEAHELALELRSAGAGLVRVGTTGGLGDRLTDILAVLAHRRPEVRVLLEAAHTPVKIARVRSGELDAAFVREPGPVPDDLRLTPLWDDPLAVLLPASSPLARRRRIGLTALAELRVMLPDRRASPGVHARILGAFTDAGVTLRPAPSRGGAQETFAEVAFGGDLAAVVYATTVPAIEAQGPPGVVVRPLRDPAPAVGCSLLTRARPSARVEAFAEATGLVATST